MKRNMTLAAIIACCLAVSYVSAADQPASPALQNYNIDIDLVVTTCGPQAYCPVTITKGKTGAIGDVVRIDRNKLPLTSLIPEGQTEIEEPVTEKLDIPAQGSDKVYWYVPSEGELAGQRIYIAINNVASTTRSRIGGKTFIRILRQLEGDNPTQWLVAGEMKGGYVSPTGWPFTVLPNGNMVTIKGPKKIENTFFTGSKTLTETPSSKKRKIDQM